MSGWSSSKAKAYKDAKKKENPEEWARIQRGYNRKWNELNPIKSRLARIKSSAKQRGIEFHLYEKDLPPIGTNCPLLGDPFDMSGKRTDFSPSLDRINPKKGYVPGNVWFVGRRANTIKNDGTADEHEKIARAMRAVEASAP